MTHDGAAKRLTRRCARDPPPFLDDFDAHMTLLQRTTFALHALVLLNIPQVSPAQDPMAGMAMGDTTRMVMSPLGVSMDRLGSGTTWIPDAVTVPSARFMTGGWDLMLHGFIFGQYNKQSGPRGGDQFGSVNWGMFMASREVAGGRFQVRTMLSLDPATVTTHGYPLLLQHGAAHDESTGGHEGHGEISDRQHPHDFWMELGVMYERPVSDNLALSFYAAPSGEPALGPAAFMHRPSAMDNPFAPIGHHHQDATHISFGVLTAGVFGRAWKLEGSIFNGREPNEERWDFDEITLDSYSGRLTVNPDSNWSMSAGYGYLASPDATSPDESIRRFTAAVLHGRKLGTEGQWASTLVYGVNRSSSFNTVSRSVAVESEAILDRRNTILARAEFAQKSAKDLAVDLAPYGFPQERQFPVTTLSFGYIQELVRVFGATLGLGAMGTMNRVPADIEEVYGSRTPIAGVLFLRVRPFHRPGGMAGMHDMHRH